MNHSEFDADIKNLETRIGNIKSDLEKIREEFIKATKDFIEKWIQDKIKETVKSKPEFAKKIGSEGLGKIKADLGELIKKVPNIVEEHVNKNEHWAHCQEFCKPEEEFIASYNIPFTIKDRIRKLFGYAGEILIKYNFADTESHSEWEYDAKRPKFKYGFDISEEMESILGRYRRLYGEHERENNKLNETKRQKAKAEVEELWKKS